MPQEPSELEKLLARQKLQDYSSVGGGGDVNMGAGLPAPPPETPTFQGAYEGVSSGERIPLEQIEQRAKTRLAGRPNVNVGPQGMLDIGGAPSTPELEMIRLWAENRGGKIGGFG